MYGMVNLLAIDKICLEKKWLQSHVRADTKMIFRYP